MPPSFRHAFGLNLIETFMRITLFSIIANFTHIVFSYSKLVNFLLGRTIKPIPVFYIVSLNYSPRCGASG